jgi:uncharacterized membrane protein
MSFPPTSLARKIGIIIVAAFFTFMGITHFTSPETFVKIVPPSLPAPLLLVYVSGVFEMLGGIGVLLPKTRRYAGYGLLALLAAVYPANIYMALHPEAFPDVSEAAIYGRLPFQFVFAAIVWWAACSEKSQVIESDTAVG